MLDESVGVSGETELQSVLSEHEIREIAFEARERYNGLLQTRILSSTPSC